MPTTDRTMKLAFLMIYVSISRNPFVGIFGRADIALF